MRLATVLVAAAIALAPIAGHAFNGPELYPGEQQLYEAAQKEGMVVSFDTGPTWANWAKEFSAFQKRYPGVQVVYNDIGSSVTVVTLEKERNRPQADTAYYFAASGVDAMQKGVVAPFKPINFDKLPAAFRAPDGQWFAVHKLVIAFIVNKKLIKDVPHSWADLLKPEYRNSIDFLDPRSTGVGQVMVFAAAFANGGDMENVQPGIDYFAKLRKTGNILRIEGTTPYAKFVKGEIPIWISYENDGLKAKYIDGMGKDAAVVIPKDGSVAAPYAMSLVKHAPHPDAAKLWLNFVMSSEGQAIFAAGFVRPSVPGIELPPAVAARLPAAPQVKPLDVITAAAQEGKIDQEWASEVLR